jgi:hypothetical protein
MSTNTDNYKNLTITDGDTPRLWSCHHSDICKIDAQRGIEQEVLKASDFWDKTYQALGVDSKKPNPLNGRVVLLRVEATSVFVAFSDNKDWKRIELQQYQGGEEHFRKTILEKTLTIYDRCQACTSCGSRCTGACSNTSTTGSNKGQPADSNNGETHNTPPHTPSASGSQSPSQSHQPTITTTPNGGTTEVHNHFHCCGGNKSDKPTSSGSWMPWILGAAAIGAGIYFYGDDIRNGINGIIDGVNFFRNASPLPIVPETPVDSMHNALSQLPTNYLTFDVPSAVSETTDISRLGEQLSTAAKLAEGLQATPLGRPDLWNDSIGSATFGDGMYDFNVIANSRDLSGSVQNISTPSIDQSLERLGSQISEFAEMAQQTVSDLSKNLGPSKLDEAANAVVMDHGPEGLDQPLQRLGTQISEFARMTQETLSGLKKLAPSKLDEAAGAVVMDNDASSLDQPLQRLGSQISEFARMAQETLSGLRKLAPSKLDEAAGAVVMDNDSSSLDQPLQRLGSQIAYLVDNLKQLAPHDVNFESDVANIGSQIALLVNNLKESAPPKEKSHLIRIMGCIGLVVLISQLLYTSQRKKNPESPLNPTSLSGDLESTSSSGSTDPRVSDDDGYLTDDDQDDSTGDVSTHKPEPHRIRKPRKITRPHHPIKIRPATEKSFDGTAAANSVATNIGDEQRSVDEGKKRHIGIYHLGRRIGKHRPVRLVPVPSDLSQSSSSKQHQEIQSQSKEVATQTDELTSAPKETNNMSTEATITEGNQTIKEITHTDGNKFIHITYNREQVYLPVKPAQYQSVPQGFVPIFFFSNGVFTMKSVGLYGQDGTLAITEGAWDLLKKGNNIRAQVYRVGPNLGFRSTGLISNQPFQVQGNFVLTHAK